MESEKDVHPIVRNLLELKLPPQHSPEWYAMRDKMLTASDVAAAIGVNPYQSRDKLLRKKLGDDKYQFKGNAATRWGNENEEIAAKHYEEKTNKKIYHFGLIQHPMHSWLGGSPDGITDDGILIEIKCPIRRKIKHECPFYYIPQVQVLLEILNLEVAHFVQFCPETTWTPMEFDVVVIHRDRNWFKTYLPLMRSFREEWVRATENGGLAYLKTRSSAWKNRSRSSASGSSSDESSPSSHKRKKLVSVDLAGDDRTGEFAFLQRDSSSDE